MEKMTVDEIVKDIIRKEDNILARAFTMSIGRILINNNIQPILIKKEIPQNFNLDADRKLYLAYEARFDINTEEHDKIVYNQALDDFIKEVKLVIDDLRSDDPTEYNHAVYNGLCTSIEIAEVLKKGEVK